MGAESWDREKGFEVDRKSFEQTPTNCNMHPLSLGDMAYDKSQFEKALGHYTDAIAKFPSADAFIKRSLCNAKLGKHAEAASDAAASVALSGGNATTAAKAVFRKGIALFNLERKDEAKQAFADAKGWGCAEKTLDIWIAKVGGIDDVVVNSLANAPAVQNQNFVATSSAVATQNPSQVAPAGESASIPITPAAAFLPPAKIRHEWMQNENFVTIAIFVKGLPKDDSNIVQIVYTANALSVTIKLPSGSDYMLELDPLFDTITPSDCKHSVMNTKVEIKLKKAVVGIKWADLEATDAAAPSVAMASTTVAPAYPSSSKKKTDWDSLVRNEEEEKPEGEAALHALFKTIYKDASDDTRRAMVKSYQESGGTVLSTNWSEIGKETVKVSPPEGMEAKKFEV
ncbi:SGS domain-containing protein [Chytriomyces sp. MP71]|nr:SGS domain-containing protein [Chytriomyces sp. MP71]